MANVHESRTLLVKYRFPSNKAIQKHRKHCTNSGSVCAICFQTTCASPYHTVQPLDGKQPAEYKQRFRHTSVCSFNAALEVCHCTCCFQMAFLFRSIQRVWKNTLEQMTHVPTLVCSMKPKEQFGTDDACMEPSTNG